MSKPMTLLDLDAVERHAAEGLAEYQIAAALGVSPDTLGRRKRDQAGVAEALVRGRACAVGLIENVAFECARRALGAPQYQTAMIFWLKVNAGWKERTVVETVSTDDRGDTRDALVERVRALARGGGFGAPDGRA